MSLLACCFVTLFGASPAAISAGAAIPADWDRGFVLTTWWHDRYGGPEAAASLRRLRATGANAVALIATWYQPDTRSSTVTPDPRRTPSDESLVSIAREAKSHGLKVMLRPMVDVDTGASRTTLDPRSPRGWFRSYRRMVAHYAGIASAAGVDAFQVGVELGSLTRGHETRWRALIAETRARFAGELSYGANWDEYARIPWWDDLDIIAIDAYFPLAPDPRPRTENEIARAWRDVLGPWGRRRYLAELRRVQRRHGKPVVFSEVGYASTEANLVEPWRTGETYSGDTQVRALNALMRTFAGRPWFRGVYIWQWPVEAARGGVGDTDHTPRGKPAEGAVTAWFQGAGGKLQRRPPR